jgi:small subunit ribosomal protein S21
LIVERREGESQDQLLSRFRTLVQRTGILREIKKRRHFISKSEARRMAQARAARRARKRNKTTTTR